jgi:hypothetical protein
MVQVFFGNSQPWNSHEDIRAHRMWHDRPIGDRYVGV